MHKVAQMFFFSLFIGLFGCSKPHNADILLVATSAEYPPFEYKSNGVTQGFDIDLVQLVAKKIGKKVEIVEMPFGSILAALESGQVDAAISTITITPARKAQFDFSTPYYFDEMAMVISKKAPLQDVHHLSGKKIAVQLGTTMEIWLKNNAPSAEVTHMDNNYAAIESLKVGRVEGVLMDGAQAVIFAKKNPTLTFKPVVQSQDGYGIAFPKGSVWLKSVNQALSALKKEGALETLKHKWLEAH